MAGKKTDLTAAKLAQWFVEAVLGDRFDFAVHRRYLGEARRILDAGVHPDDVQEAVRLALKAGLRPRTLWVIRYRSPSGRTFLEDAREVPDPPPVYQADAYDTWFRTWGPKAARLKPDLALYQGWDAVHRTPESGPLTFRELLALVGPQLALQALRAYQRRFAKVKSVKSELNQETEP